MMAIVMSQPILVHLPFVFLEKLFHQNNSRYSVILPLAQQKSRGDANPVSNLKQEKGNSIIIKSREVTIRMAYIFAGIILVVFIVWGVKASKKKKISGTSYTPYDDIIYGKVNSHPPIEVKNDSKHSTRYEEISLSNENEK